MVQIIAGRKGKGKTKYLLEKCNNAVGSTNGSIVYLDKSGKHMYELNNKVRLINVSEYGLSSYDAFIGFLCGLVSQDHDLEQVYLDSFLRLSYLEGKDITEAVGKLEELGRQYNITFVLSVSADESDLPETVKKNIVISL